MADYLTIQSIQLLLVDPEKIKRTCFLIESPETWDQNTPVKNGLFDLRMGVIDRRYVCQTCGQKEWACPGHMGYMILCKPCFNPLMVDYVVKVLRSVCPDCSALLIPPSEIKEQTLDWVSNEVSSKAAYRFCCVGHPGDVGVQTEDGSEPQFGCRAHRADYTKTDGLHIKGIYYEPKAEDPADEVEEEGKKKKRKKRNLANQFTTKEFIITAEKAYKILRKISPEHAKYMGFGENQHPSWMIMTNLPILPPSERPSIQMNAQRRGEDDLTCAIFAIIKVNTDLVKKIAQGCHSAQLHALYELLQYRVATYITNDIQKQPSAKQRSGRVSQGIVQKIKGKEGLVRGNLMGKRVDFSARSVITGDPSLSITEVGMPMEMAMILTKRIPVTAENIDECWERVMKGPYVYGGANSIIKKIKGREYIVDLKLTRDRSEITLRKGHVIEAHLEDGDYVLFNRQPTLHRLGMMGHKVKVVKTYTLRMNPSDTPPYNADFDGVSANFSFFFYIITSNYF
jgi:DNA-directed RNA polymerase II subunit RPB1